MDVLKLVPQVFFDLIGRVVPGAAAIVAALVITSSTWEYWLSAIVGKELVTKSPTAAFVLLFASSYVVGQLLSPLAKLVQRIGELFGRKPKDFPEKYSRKAEGFRKNKIFYLYSLVRPEPKAKGYDWLRANHPEAGAHCAKIRGEFTMHNGLAAVFLSSAAVYPFRGQPWHATVLTILIVASVVEFGRGRTTRDTFNKTVREFEKAKGYQEPAA
jgi:hypothetical protein